MFLHRKNCYWFQKLSEKKKIFNLNNYRLGKSTQEKIILDPLKKLKLNQSTNLKSHTKLHNNYKTKMAKKMMRQTKNRKTKQKINQLLQEKKREKNETLLFKLIVTVMNLVLMYGETHYLNSYN